MRRRTATDDSLDLFLDTICNMFGGIIFVVMLLVLLSFGRSAAIVEDAGLTTVEHGEIVQQHRDRDELKARRKVLENALTGLNRDLEILRESVPPDVWDGLQTLLVQIEAAERELAEYDRFWKELNERRARTKGQLAEQDEIVKTLTVEIEQAKRELDLITQSQTVEARLPVTRRTTKTPVFIMLRGGKGYLLYAVSRGLSTNTPEDRDVEMRPVEGGNLFTAREGGGFPVSSTISEEQRWLELLHAVDPHRQQLVFTVYPDSYEPFLFIKTASLRAGLQYDVVPMGESDPMTLWYGMHDTSQ